MNIVLLGAPGAGKGTQANVLKAKYDIPHISTGDILREKVKDGSEIGQKAKTFMDSGQLVPDNIVIEMVKERLEANDCNNGFILDGFPRTKNQAEALDESLTQLDKKIDSALNFDASEDVILKRLTGRRVCQKCGKIYHITNMPPKAEGICDECGSALIQRKDDQEATIINRLKVYRDSTQPLLDYYKNKGLLKTIPADKDYRDIEKILNEYFNAK